MQKDSGNPKENEQMCKQREGISSNVNIVKKDDLGQNEDNKNSLKSEDITISIGEENFTLSNKSKNY